MLQRVLTTRLSPVAAVLLLAALAGCGQGQTGGRPGASSTPTGPAASTPAPSPAAPVPTPTMIVSPIPLPSDAEIDARANGLVWALVGGLELFRSTDRGQTWQQRPLPVQLGSAPVVSFVDDREGWLLVTGPAASSCQSQAATIWHTADAGTSWLPLTAAGIGGARCKSSLSFTDPTHGFLVLTDPDHAPVVLRSADGGLTWSTSAPLPAPPGVTAQLSPGQVRSFGSTLLVQVDTQGHSYVYRADAGATAWRAAAETPFAPPILGLASAARWVLLNPGAARETLDGGATWHVYQTDYGQAAPVAADVVFGDAATGYATVRGQIQRTLDGGAHWSTIHTPGTNT